GVPGACSPCAADAIPRPADWTWACGRAYRPPGREGRPTRTVCARSPVAKNTAPLGAIGHLSPRARESPWSAERDSPSTLRRNDGVRGARQPLGSEESPLGGRPPFWQALHFVQVRYARLHCVAGLPKRNPWY